MNRVRNPQAPEVLRLDLLRWLTLHEQDDQDAMDEADVELEAALLREGVLSLDDVVESFEPLYWRGVLCGVVVLLERGTAVYLSSTTGTISNVVE